MFVSKYGDSFCAMNFMNMFYRAHRPHIDRYRYRFIPDVKDVK